jgi:nitroreductase
MDNKIKEDIEKILSISVNAPSGSNSQPWEFQVKDNVIEIIAHPEKDHPILNFKNRGTYIAHGALIENIKIASKHFGYEPQIELFPYKENLNITARIILSKTNASDETLFEAISERATNRKPYFKEKLNDDEINFLLEEINKFLNVEVIVINDEKKIKDTVKNLANDMVIYLQNKTLHELLFKEIIWSSREVTREGLYVKTLEVKAPQVFAFKLLKNWNISKSLAKRGLHYKIAEENYKIWSSTPLLISFGLKKEEAKDFINTGRCIENIWLRATKLNLGTHIITGILFLWQQLQFGRKEIFSNDDIEVIESSYANILNSLNLKDKLITAFLRIGKSNSPSAFSFKKQPIIKLQ